MSTETATIACAKCTHANDYAAKYCQGCGQALWETCVGCNTAVRIGAKFCGGCGDDLQSRFEKRMQEVEQTLRLARQKAEAFDYEGGLAFAKRAAKPADFRFAEIARKASELVSRIERAQEAWRVKSTKVFDAAKLAFEQENYARVIGLVTKIPVPLRSQELQQLISQSQNADSEYARLVNTLRDALQQKDYLIAASAVDRLGEIKPESVKFYEAAEKICKSLFGLASQAFAHGEYQMALEYLDALPNLNRDSKLTAGSTLPQPAQIAELHRRVRTVAWLMEQFPGQPWATEQLARMAQRWEQTVPNDKRAIQRRKELAAAVQRPLEDPRSMYRDWDRQEVSWMGGPVKMLTAPQGFGPIDHETFREQASEFSQALGLAVQGLGKAFFSDVLYRKETSGLKKLFKRKSAKQCIGVDAGNNGVRAVRLEMTDEGTLRVLGCWRHAFPHPLCRAGLESQQPELQETALRELKLWIGDDPIQVWINQPARDVLGKFVEFPPVKDKELQTLLEREISHCFPMAAADLSVASWYDPTESERSRNAIIVAAKHSVVRQRIAKFQDVGIDPTAVQCEQIALANFAMHEFSDAFGPEQTDDGHPNEDQPPPAIAIVDYGASGATLLVLSRMHCFFRSIDGGGEDLTAALARSTKVTAEKAERWKRDPAVMPDPGLHFAVLAERMRSTSARLELAFQEAKKTLGLQAVQAVWCVGASSLTHDWARQLLAIHDDFVEDLVQ